MCLWCHWSQLAWLSSSSRRNIGRWGGRCARVREWKPCQPGLRPHHWAHYDGPWLGHPSCNRGRGRSRTGRCSRRSIWGGLGALGNSAGRRHITIPALPDPSHLRWTASPSARPQSLSPVAIDRWLPLGPWRWSPPVTPSPSPHSSAWPQPCHPGGRPHGPPSGMSPGPWARTLSVLWWHRTPASYQGPSAPRR